MPKKKQEPLALGERSSSCFVLFFFAIGKGIVWSLCVLAGLLTPTTFFSATYLPSPPHLDRIQNGDHPFSPSASFSHINSVFFWVKGPCRLIGATIASPWSQTMLIATMSSTSSRTGPRFIAAPLFFTYLETGK
ncbi:hypothetical protein L228DRAFT_243246 [Xylona heveae TC161]|uniref:Uncharacterized protein n=1 Tax=Xylona heveae (strain CBS 132557 / TC161) TaxID=1328760 RepID=A0A165JX62_XYLHT|nr:hypothetical protein L228DRAFT_243246 [Xylona heveae TC161]KZF26735.1 hypothetical protein L228DRAFT_243246 [Xylona heveae TC161]